MPPRSPLAAPRARPSSGATVILLGLTWLLVHVTPALARSGPGPAAAVADAIRVRVEQLRIDESSPVRGTRLRAAEAVSTFFEARGFEPAWALPSAANDVLEVVRAVEREGLSPRDYHLATLELAILDLGTSRSPEVEADLQVLLSDAVAAFIDHVRYGRVEPRSLDRTWNVDPRVAAPPLATLLEQVAGASSIKAAIERFVPNHFIYVGLRQALARYRDLAAAGGWPLVPAGPTLKPGMTDGRVRILRARLRITGELPADESIDQDLYDAALEAAVKKFQEHHRLTADGAVGKLTLDTMNVPVTTRIGQIRVNLERIRWVLGGLRDSFVLVNLPAFKLYVIRDGVNVWETRTQIGKVARQTPSFFADMQYIVLNPDWTVPPTILREDVLRPMAQGQDVIRRKGLTVIDRQGRAVDPATIDWKAARAAGFPYTLRQPPGPSNALGRVKFMFPNPYAIFLHDTPSRELFSADTRTFSSGCIRVERPLDLAAVLLEENEGWTRDRIQQVIESGRTETVFLARPLPVLIVYWTVSVGVSGEVRFGPDVYQRDAVVLRALDAGTPR